MLQETKQNHKEMNKDIEQQRQYRGSISATRGALGGIATISNQGIRNCISETINQHQIKTTLENKVDQQAIIIYNIYVPNHCRDKDSCWHDLKDSLDKCRLYPPKFCN